MKLHVRIWFAGCGRHHTHYTGSQIHVEDASWCWRRCANNSNLVYSLHCYQLKFQFGHKVRMNCFILKRFCGHLVIRQYIFCWIVLASYKLCVASPFSEPLGCLAEILLRNHWYPTESWTFTHIITSSIDIVNLLPWTFSLSLQWELLIENFGSTCLLLACTCVGWNCLVADQLCMPFCSPRDNSSDPLPYSFVKIVFLMPAMIVFLQKT